MGRSATNSSRRLLLLLAIALLAPAATALAGVVFDGSPGTAAPPPTLGGFVMQPFPLDGQALGVNVTGVVGPTGTINFAPPFLSHRRVGGVGNQGWGTWSHGYLGDVYYSNGALTVTITMPANTKAFYMYAEPDNFLTYDIQATSLDGGNSLLVPTSGNGGAKYFGFYETGNTFLASVTVTILPNGSGSPEGVGIGEFGIAAGSDNPLPVEVTHFNASQADRNVNLAWATASETDNAGFEIQRAENDGAFHVISSYVSDGSLAGLGTSAIGRHYTYSDNLGDNVVAGTSYTYRLLDVSLSGERQLKNEAQVKISPKNDGLLPDPLSFHLSSVSPNPASGHAGIEFTLPQGAAVKVDIVDESGRVVATPVDRVLPAGTHVQNFATTDLRSGSYTVVLQSGTSRRTAKLVIVR